MDRKLCILLSTCDRYRPLALFTRDQIVRFWPGHPPVFFCGLSGEIEHGLPLRDDSANWMKITLRACRDLIARGFMKTYLILEDHPPFAACHEEHLNETLPRVMDELEATCLALSGPGQHRSWHGRPMRAEGYTFDHIAPEARWKFSLHPALWNLAHLERLLVWMVEHFAEAEQNPWAFERKGGDPAAGVPVDWTTRSYRVVGSQMARPLYSLRRIPMAVLQFGFDCAAFLVRIFGGAEARARFDVAVRGVYCPYDGPYPLFWSGLMRKGVLSGDLIFWLRLTGRQAWLNRIPPVAP